ncbi:MAG TPA: FkbM family methyltransferase [Isosphaeraceae bacterium]|jgi:FkbM family methyltransferase|nr:FkbM family methyltransferase [Isosphaeraceae bacterium]
MPIAGELAVVAPLAAFLGRPLVLVDVGCRWGLDETWAAFGPHIRRIGFDPDAEECARLERLNGEGARVRFVPAGLGPAVGSSRLHLTREPACSSLYPPDLEAMRQRPELSCIEPTGTATIPLTTLDAWAATDGLDRVDILKLDTQGSELDILRGSERLLPTVRAIEVEVEFNPIYRGQPLFGDVDRFLRDRGFVLWRLGHLVHYGMAGARSDFAVEEWQCFDSRALPSPRQGGQLYWAHAYFVRHEAAFPRPSADWRSRLADACAFSAFGFRDLAGSCLRHALEDAPRDVAPAILAALSD